MSVRQYIGARYVPKFYENSLGSAEWQAGVIYEPLTIVTYNGNSYTSKKTVPANIGNPSANNAYWVATGIFNQQLEEIANRVGTIEDSLDTIDDDITALENKTAFYTPEMYGAAGDGVTDDTTAIQAMFDDVPDESVIVFDKDKYLISSQILITGNNLIIKGRLGRSEASPQIRGAITGAPFILNRGSGNFFYDLILWNLNESATNCYGILFDADNATYNGNVDARLFNCGFVKFAEAVQCLGRNLELNNCIFSTCTCAVRIKQTTISTELRGYNFNNNRIHSTQTFVINDVSNSLTPKNIKISNNFLDFASTLFYGYGGGVVIDNNLLDAKGVGGTLITIKGDALNSNDYINHIMNNTFYGGANTSNGISCEDDVKVVVKGNLITNVKANGIVLAGNGFGVIKDNVVENCGQNSGSYSIVASGTATGIIEGNVMYNCTRYIGGATVMTKENNYQL